MKSRALWAEFFGVFALVFVGTMAIATNSMAGAEIGRVGVALAHGFTIAVFAAATMAISGGHLNPAISFGAWMAKRITFNRMIGYWVVQCAGAIAAAFLVQAVLPADLLLNASMGVPTLAPEMIPPVDQGDMTVQQALAQGEKLGMYMGIMIEAVLTFFLMYAVLGTAADWRAHKMGGLFIGLAVTIGILAAGPLTGAAMNPARWLGPAFFDNNYSNWLVYTAGPILGAAIAVIVYGQIPERGDIAPGVNANA